MAQGSGPKAHFQLPVEGNTYRSYSPTLPAMTRNLAVALALLLMLTACGGGEAQTCDEIATQTVDLIQDLIDDVDAEFEEMSIEEFLALGDDLPSLESFRTESEAIDERAAELGCTQTELAADVIAQADRLEANTELGEFVIELLVGN